MDICLYFSGMNIRSEFAGSFGAWELSVEGVRWGQERLPKGADRSQVMEEAGGH